MAQTNQPLPKLTLFPPEGKDPSAPAQVLQSAKNKSSDKKDAEYVRSGTFLTSVRNTARDTLMTESKMQPIEMMYKELASEVENANDYMKAVVDSHQDDLLLAYKLEMQKVYKDYKVLNEKLEKVKEERRNNEQLKALKDELAWFRDEALKLHDKCEEQKEMITRMKNTLDILEEDRKYFQQQLIKSKRVGKLLAGQLEEYAAKFPDFRVRDGVLDDDEQAPSSNPGGSFSLNRSSFSEEKASEEVLEEGRIALPEEGFGNAANQDLLLEKVTNENDELKNKQHKYEDIISQLSHRLENEKRGLKELKSKGISENYEKSEIKEHFLNCIEGVRKDIIKRRLTATRQTKVARMFESRIGPQTTKNLKGPVEDPEFRPKLSSFTAVDKRKVIEMLLANEAVLMKIYEALFINNSGSQRKLQTMRKSNTRLYL